MNLFTHCLFCLFILSLLRLSVTDSIYGVFAEWRSGVAGHLILSDEDLTSVVQGNWKRLNTLQHYKVHRLSLHHTLELLPNVSTMIYFI